MFSPKRAWTHRAKLTALLTATVSIALGLVFILVIVLVRNQAMNRRYAELESNLDRVTKEYKNPSSLEEEKEDFPGDTFSVFNSQGELLASAGKNAPPFVVGYSKGHGQLYVGLKAKKMVFVGGSSWRETATGLRLLALVLGLLWLPLTALTALVAWYGGGLVLRPITELVESAEKLSGEADGAILTTTDHAEFATLADRLNQLIARVHRSASVQEQFAADAAHELRNPLAMLRMRIEANLLKDRPAEEHVASQQKMLVQIDRLTAIVEALLLSARQRDEKPDVEEFDALVIQASTEWADLTGWPLERLHLDIASCKAQISRDELGLILRNLLDNASRHAPEQTPIEVTVSSSAGSVRVEIRDYGIGIPADDLERVFDRFYRADSARDRSHGGTGIGLSIVRRIVQTRGGTVRAEPVAIGTLVVVSFPTKE